MGKEIKIDEIDATAVLSDDVKHKAALAVVHRFGSGPESKDLLEMLGLKEPDKPNPTVREYKNRVRKQTPKKPYSELTDEQRENRKKWARTSYLRKKEQ